MDDWADTGLWLGELRRSRLVFHSEADFQHALALAIAASDPGARVRPETRPLPGTRLDLLVSGPGLGGYLAVELKYLTAAWAGEDGGEHFKLLAQGAQDIRAYDIVKDVQRAEQPVDGHPGWRGLVLVLVLVLVLANDQHTASVGFPARDAFLSGEAFAGGKFGALLRQTDSAQLDRGPRPDPRGAPGTILPASSACQANGSSRVATLIQARIEVLRRADRPSLLALQATPLRT